jgi:hypothetical protein
MLTCDECGARISRLEREWSRRFVAGWQLAEHPLFEELRLLCPTCAVTQHYVYDEDRLAAIKDEAARLKLENEQRRG